MRSRAVSVRGGRHPGFVEGASHGKGLGHQFLRHIERARVLVLLLDMAGGPDGQMVPADQRAVLLLGNSGRTNPNCWNAARLVVGSRSDMAPAADDDPTIDIHISAVTGENLPVLVGRMADAVRGAVPPNPCRSPSWFTGPPVKGFASNERTTAAIESSAARRSAPLHCPTSPTSTLSTWRTTVCES